MKTAYINGTIYTMKAEGDTVEAFLVENGKFAYCGTNEEVLKLAGGCEVVDLNGAPVLPGMIDTHQHLYAYARDLLKLDLKKANSLKELLEMIRVRAEATPKGEWILGTGFDH